MPSGARSSENAEIIVQVRNPDGNAAATGIHLRLEIEGKGSTLDCRQTGPAGVDLRRAAQVGMSFE
jgi:hypothetical protein